jgi:hypothetical protein
MDYRIQKPQNRCASSDRPLAAGEPFYSVLAREDGKVVRIDIAPDAWQGPPEQCLAWWRSTVPLADAKPSLAPVDVLLDLLEQLAGVPEDAPLRYLLALVLVRRRILKIVDPAEEEQEHADDSVLFVSCRRRDTSYSIAVIPEDSSRDEGLERRLHDLLWTGEAA